MSIIQLTENQIESKKGIDRKIDQSFQKKMIDIVQKTQYQYPIESCIRELVSNSVDAVNEKIIARKILSGQNKEEDFFITRNDSEYKDSNFDKSYYNLEYFDPEDTVKITLHEKEGQGWCDNLIILDKGVGISPQRFYKMSNFVGFSTKRNTNQGFGSFGIGNKSALSTGVDYYTMVTCYNGYIFKANIYNHKTDYLVGKFNLENNTENKAFTVKTENGEDFVIYGEPTASKNYTEVTIPSKRFNRDKYTNAIKSQLLYFDKVQFEIINEEGSERNVDFKAKVLYNSDNIIISDNYYYSRPHILITKDKQSNEAVCYGYLNFEELEMQQLYSSVGIKCQIRSTYIDEKTGEEIVLRPGVDVTPSRESIIWNETTKEYIIEQFKRVQEEASLLVESKLKDDDIISWCIKASNVLNNSGSDIILNRMSRIIDSTKISPKFNNTQIKFKENPSHLFKGYKLRTLNYRTYSNKPTIYREDTRIWHNLNLENVYYKSTDTNRTKELYIFQSSNLREIVTLEPLSDEEIVEICSKVDNSKNILSAKEVQDIIDKKTKEYFEYRNLLKTYLDKTKFLKNYDNIDIPDDWKSKIEEQEEAIEKQEAVDKLTPAELRKLNEQTVINRFRIPYNNYNNNIFRAKHELKISELLNSTKHIIYGDTESEEKLKLAFILTKNQFKDSNISSDDNKEIILIANANKKYVKNKTIIDKFFKNLTDDNVITMDNMLIKWYTARLIKNRINSYRFINTCFKQINSDVYDIYEELNNYINNNYNYENIYNNKEIYTEFLEHTDKVFQMQLFVSEGHTEEEIKQKSFELFGSDLVKDGYVVDMEMYHKLNWLTEYCDVIAPLFNDSYTLTKNISVSKELLEFYNEILISKGLFNYNYNNLKVNNKEVELESV